MNEQEIISRSLSLESAIVLKEKLAHPYAALLAHHVMTTFDDRVMKGIDLWMKNQLTDDFAVEGASIGEIRSAYGGCSAFVALNVLNLFLKDPDALYNYTWFEGVDEIL